METEDKKENKTITEKKQRKQRVLNFIFNKKNPSKSVFFILITLFFLLDLFIAIFLFATRHSSPLFMESYQSSKMTRLYALNKTAHKGISENNEISCYKFSEEQKAIIKALYENYESVGLTVRISLWPSKSDSKNSLKQEKPYFKYGFLNSYDFTEKGKFIPFKYITNQRVVVQGNLKNSPETFDVSFALKKSENADSVIPSGFFIYSDLRCKIEGLYASPAKIGFDISSKTHFYGFSSAGGEIDFSNSHFDFSGAHLVFSSNAGSSGLHSQFVIKFSENEKLKSTIDNSIRSEINFGGENISLKNVKVTDKVIFPAFALKNPYSLVQLKSKKECIESIILENNVEDFSSIQKINYIFNESTDGKTESAGGKNESASGKTESAGGKNESASGKISSSREILFPIKTDPGLILNYPEENWRNLDYEIFSWDRFSKIIFFDTKNYEVQDRFFRRMAFFVEKAGYKGRLLSDSELDGKHGYNAHDYSSESMAAFFNKATQLNFPLNDEEKLLKKILIANNYFETDGNFVKANDGGLVSVSRETPSWNRSNLLAHEGWHTLFFKDADFRNYVSAVYNTMDPYSLSFLIKYFQSQSSLGYDVTDEYLMNNEFMAYMLQQNLSYITDYYVLRASWGSVVKFCPNEAEYIKKTNARGLEDAAIALNDYVFDNYGLVAGNIYLVTR